MTAVDRKTAARLEVGERVRIVRSSTGRPLPTRLKSKGVEVVEILAKTSVLTTGGRRSSRQYLFETTGGPIKAAASETFGLAPDPEA